jgi:hypothetical protein
MQAAVRRANRRCTGLPKRTKRWGTAAFRSRARALSLSLSISLSLFLSLSLSLSHVVWCAVLCHYTYIFTLTHTRKHTTVTHKHYIYPHNHYTYTWLTHTWGLARPVQKIVSVESLWCVHLCTSPSSKTMNTDTGFLGQLTSNCLGVLHCTSVPPRKTSLLEYQAKPYPHKHINTHTHT